MAARGALLLVAGLLSWSSGFAQTDDPTCGGAFSTQSRYFDAAVTSNASYWCCNSYTSTYPSGLPLPSSSLVYPVGWSLPTTTGPSGMAFNFPCHIGGSAFGGGSGVDITPGVNFGKKINVVTSCPVRSCFFCVMINAIYCTYISSFFYTDRRPVGHPWWAV